ncbi:MAG: ABC transporter permease [Eubacterium sp.]|nr:ABC transporter permease [Eubacterium sp.]
MKKNRILNKCFFNSKGYMILCFLTVVACFFSMCYYNVMNETLSKMELIKTINTYGEYHFMVKEISDSQVQELLAEDYIKKYEIMECDSEEESENLYVSSDFFDFSNYDIIRGKFPENEGEVIAPEWYLFKLGIPEEQMIGAKIEVRKRGEETKEEKVVSGTFTAYGEEQSTNPVFLMKKGQEAEKDQLYNVYVQTENVNVEKYYNSLAKKYDWGNDGGRLNKEYLSALGESSEDEKYNYRDKVVYYIILVFIMFFVFMIINTIYKLFFEKGKKSFYIVKLLGLNMKSLRRFLLFRTSILVFLGEIIGVISGILVAYVILRKSMGENLEAYNIVKIYYSHEFIAISLGLGILINLFIVAKEMRSLMKNSAYEVQTETQKTSTMKQKSLLKNGRFSTVKMAYGNFRFYYNQKMSLILTIIVFVAMTVLLTYQKQQREVNENNNNQYNYLFQVKDYFDYMGKDEERAAVVKKYDKLIKLLEENHVTPYYNNYRVEGDVKISKKYLTDQVKEKLNNSAWGRSNLRSMSDSIPMDIVYMGASDDMVKEMTQKDIKLKDDELLVCSQYLGMKDGKNCPLNDMTGESIEIELASDELETKTYHVVGMADKICVYPTGRDKDSICIFMNEKVYKKVMALDFVTGFYVKDMNPQTLNKVREFLKKDPDIQVINQKEELAQIKFNEEQKSIMIYMLFVLCNLMAGLGLVLQQVQDLKNRLAVNHLLKKLGLSKVKRNLIILEETLVGNMLGMLLGIGCSRILLLALREVGVVVFASLDSTMIGISFAFFLVFTMISYFYYVISDSRGFVNEE